MTDNMDALYITDFAATSIAETYDLSFYSRAGTHKKRNIITSLQEVGVDVTVVSPLLFSNNTFQYYAGRTVRDDKTGSTVHIPPAIDVYGFNFLFAILATTMLVLRLLVREQFDTVLFYNFRAKHAIPAAVARAIFRRPTILDYEDGVFLHENLVIRWSGKLLRQVCGPAVDGAICVNRPLADIAPTTNTVIVRGYPSIGMPDEVDNLGDTAEDVDPTTIMFAGRFDGIRGIDAFLDAIPAVKSESEVRFWISGYGPDAEVERVEQRVMELDDPRVTFFGTLPWENYRKRITQADIFVNLQHPGADQSRYTFPSKLLDFMSAGGVIVSTDMSDLRTEFADIYRFIDEESDAATAIEAAIDAYQHGDCSKRRRQAQEWVQTNCNHTRVGRDMLSLLEGV